MKLRSKFLASIGLAAALGACTTMTEDTMTASASDTTITTPSTAMTAAQMVADYPLIPREELYGNPTRAGGQISPDGQYVSWLAPQDGVMNVWVAPASNPDSAKVITSADDRPIRSYFWAPDGKSVLYVQDKGGDENFLLYGIDIASGEERTLTPFENTRVQIFGGSETIKDKILVGLNNRDPRLHDAYMLDLNTGELELVMENPGYIGFVADDDLNLRWAMAQNAAGGMDLFRIVDGEVAQTPTESWGMEDSLTTRPAGYNISGDTFYWLDSRDRNTAALIAQDVETGEKRIIAQSDKADIGGIITDKETGEPLAYSVNYLKSDWTFFDDDLKASYDWLDARLDGEFGIQSRTDDDRTWLVWNDPLTAPASTYVYDRDAKTLTKFYTARPELEGAPLQPMQPLEIASRDGNTLVSYLTLPPGADKDGDGVPEAAVPMVLLVHGGPWARDGYGYNSAHQWLANRGYAVMSVNFRGSTGFGKDFTNAGNLEWSGKMHDDLIDAKNWAVARGVTTDDGVAIMGGSYGGYATLVGLAYTPDEFACGVDIVGPSNLETLLETIPPYWEPMVKQFHTRMGDPKTPEGLQLLKDASPLYRASAITKPLLIGQGANDPRVKQAESDQIVEAMQASGIPVTYVLFPDEGHGFAKPNNNIAFNAVTENFLATCLGGRAEPVGDTVENSTAEIVTGREYVQGLGSGG